MSAPIAADICVIGAGAGGLSVAAGAARMGAKTVLIEKAAMGGDCLNSGCVPSKALLAAGKAAEAVRRAHRFGVEARLTAIDGRATFARVEAVIQAIAPHDSTPRFEGLGVRVIAGTATFTDRRTVRVGERDVRARRFVIATGSHPFVPPIPGLDETPFLTNETVFKQQAIPERLIVIGGGPIGVEMAQAHRRLGARVTILEMAGIMAGDDPELVQVVRARLNDEGIDVHENTAIDKVEGAPGAVRVFIRTPSGAKTAIAGSHLLIAAGRRPNIADLGLETAGVAHDDRAIAVDRRLRTTNGKIFAIGDVIGRAQFTHAAGYHAGVVIRNALLRLPAKADGVIPRVTYSDPELAQVGLNEAAARARFGAGGVRVLSSPFTDNDRARCEDETDGLIKVICTHRGRVLGAGIVGPHAGELILPWVLVLSRGLKIDAMAAIVAPYPTLSEIGKRAAGSFFTPRLFSPFMRKLVRFLALFG
ncbi:dihydrolipoyl dehydrogenase family protein [Varunaivibrio sulfuroxidans]|uniref:Pyruvate/2-oxoglutarate dehydrogenase complex dihydrolipoamide dehydrogenase (E3) component n=1 Tax=Varunaivibrio sulfuroxidans TaxID=1773489 RepID=A0A4R3JI05_9PROT|nr:FAD-dependent oxidoreductase [Varunaivibrio sulfuroxidans]TCS65003.1 pyruvate/2-oxoglutarate dehydrogenase complex dihydrolipoamide dehydrogenase (E3) component [Varunaivibrio sulfuroxidans]WES29707.1 FAD-dependent oxidoreductase [Varunaivibrio sulfuroxidans]